MATTIKAIRNGETREFDADFWNKMPDNKYGWKQAADAPDEVKDLQQAGGGSNAGTAEPKVNAADLAKQIYEAETAEAVDALVPDGETRTTVLQAAEKRKAQLSNPQ